MFDGLLQDLRDAARSLGRHKVVTAIAVASLALAIGANSALFTVVDTYVLRGTGAPEPERLVRIYQSESSGEPWGTFSYLGFADHERQAKSLSHLAVEAPRPMNLSVSDRGERILGAMVSGSYFPLLQRPAAVGRFIGRGDDELASPSAVAVLGERFWRRRFAADPNIVGRDVHLNGRVFRIIGVAPTGFSGTIAPLTPDVYVPVTTAGLLDPTESDMANRGGRWLMAMGRLAPGATRQQAEAELGAITRALGREFPADSGRMVSVIAEHEGRVFPAAKGIVLGFLGMLFAVITLVLLVACANVASLLLARGEARRQEFAVRAALGAGRGRLIRQLLMESGLIGMGGAVVGFAIAHVLCRLLTRFQPPIPIPMTFSLQPDARVLAFAIAIGFATSLIFGLMSGIQSTSVGLLSRVRDGGLTSTRRSRLRRALVVVQLATTLVLLGGAGLFMRALVRAQTLDPGFDIEHVGMASLDFKLSGYRLEAGRQFAEQVAERLRQRPDVSDVAITDQAPLGLAWSNRGLMVEGAAVATGNDAECAIQSIGPSYLGTVGIALLRGRDFNAADRDSAPLVVIVNEAFAKHHWGGEDPIGRRINWDPSGEGPWVTVVGMTATTSTRSLAEEPRPFLYVPYAQEGEASLTMVARGTGDAEVLAATIAETARELDPDLLVYDAKSMARHLGVALLPVRIASTAFGALGLLALALSLLGLFGVIAYSVSQRTREIGLRMVFGATREDILRLVLGEGMRLVTIGVVIGFALVLAMGQLVRGFLYGVPPADPVALGSVVALLAIAALIAAWLPAHRATRIEPSIALRQD